MTTRRNLMKAILATSTAPLFIPADVFGQNAPSSRINIGLIGAGNINGNYHAPTLLGCNDCSIVGIADPVVERRTSLTDRVNKHYAKNICTPHHDFRELIARPEIDAVCIGTPDHWHAIMAITAMKAGKDVYCEKPMMHTIAEGRAMADTAAAYGRVFQTGLQQRSDKFFRFACELVRNQRIGRLLRVKVGVPGINGGIKTGVNFPTTPVPEGFDYDLWQGPAAVRPFSPERVERGDRACYWYYISDYTIGFLSGWGVHHVDIAQWGMGADLSGPTEIHCSAANIPADGLIDDAVSWHATLLYPGGIPVSFSSNGAPNPMGIRFEGDQGWVFVDRGRLDAEPKSLLKSTILPGEIHLYESPEHHRNFLDCIRSRRPTIVDAESGHRATTACNLVDIAARLGRELQWDPKKEQFVNDETANRMLSKTCRAPWRV
ncbi:MAG: Gfo/Idh/MocA family oxidoreductase [Tepidisphaeraceae bacterium]|jgi:predicted dehydrogenase